ncbi:MAG: di-heme oxidoredictase family protein [Candidatus Acidiferrales bacterium]
MSNPGVKRLMNVVSRAVLLVLGVGLSASIALAQNQPDNNRNFSRGSNSSRAVDPGVRPGTNSVGGPLDGMSGDYQSFFYAALARFGEIDSVQGTVANEDGKGLGPRFNGNSCAGCHTFPTVGGTSPANNPQIGMGLADGAMNKIPPFITPNGPVREARFIRNPDGSPDGGVHDLFVITGRVDAPGCGIQQPDFGAAIRQDNIIFRIPTPVFGLGLVEAITDSSILKNASNPHKSMFGISGNPNRSGNDGTITRFGWKAQNKSLLMFAGEAYNVEQGVTNELFPNERDETPGCMFNALPEDATNFTSTDADQASGLSSDLVNFAAFARFSAPPTPAPATPQSAMGQQLFNQIGCNLCHTPSINTGSKIASTGQSNVPVNAFSDFLVHDMGWNLADHVSQGIASGSQFRTAPLWGVGQRIFFLHDGRTQDLVDAIEQHRSQGSEANQVINNFNQLPTNQQNAVLAFLRSL